MQFGLMVVQDQCIVHSCTALSLSLSLPETSTFLLVSLGECIGGR